MYIPEDEFDPLDRIVFDRGTELLYLYGYQGRFCLIEITEDSFNKELNVTFQDYFYHETESEGLQYITLSFNELDMDDKEWKEHIKEMKEYL